MTGAVRKGQAVGRKRRGLCRFLDAFILKDVWFRLIISGDIGVLSIIWWDVFHSARRHAAYGGAC